MSSPTPTVAALVAGIANRERRSLARAITLIESSRPDHREQAEAILDAVADSRAATIRLGISGSPGVGKSTFIEAFGLHLVARGLSVAVLAIDPSSTRTGGSILGDKTRMMELARSPEAFIRPSPSRGSLGGVARRTRETMALCEAFGFDVVLVETVGVGQSETAVADMVDLFLLLVAPGGGDDLQGIKRGIMELADLVVVNKADGELANAAGRTAADYRNALQLMRPKFGDWSAEVLTCSAAEQTGIAEVWEAIERFRHALEKSGELLAHRRDQAAAAMWANVTDTLTDRFRAHRAVRELAPHLEIEVAAHRLTPSRAARQLLDAFSIAAPATDAAGDRA